MPNTLGSWAIAAPTLLVTGALALPVAAAFFDNNQRHPYLPLQVQYAANLTIGAGLGATLRLAGPAARGASIALGAGAGAAGATIANMGWKHLLGESG